MSTLRHGGIFLTLSVLWGLSFPAIAIGLEYLPPLGFAALRYDIAAVLLLGYAVVRIEEWAPVDRGDALAILGGGLFLVAGNGLLFVGQQTVPSGVAAIIQALIPIVTALWAFLLLGERLALRGSLGVLVGLVGIAFVIQPDPANLLAGDTAGRLIIVGQVISVALGGVLVQRADPSLGRTPLTGWAMAVGAVVLHGISVAAGETGSLTTVVAPAALGAVIYLGVFSTAIAFLLYFTILAEHGAFEAALVSYLVPVVATVVGVVVLGEAISVLTYLGFALVAGGFALLKREAVGQVATTAANVVRP